MSISKLFDEPDRNGAAITHRFGAIRSFSERLVAPMTPEDTVVQSMPDVSPAKWHLAHTSWFFERFILRERVADYRVFDDEFDFLFNSYYFTVGQMHRRAERGLLSRPGLARVIEYRAHVNQAMAGLLDRNADDPDLVALVELGLNHEQQHQELILTDIKHVLAQNPMRPALIEKALSHSFAAQPLAKIPLPEGIHQIGSDQRAFCFDNETPRHDVLLRGGYIASRPATNGEFLEFVRDGGYQKCDLWLSDAWATIQQHAWSKPFYWSQSLDSEFTLHGEQALDKSRPVSHLSYYEADAFARWSGARLPREEEWEVMAAVSGDNGHLLDFDLAAALHPLPCRGDGLQQMFGDVWEWTASAYTCYPGFRPLAGSLGEYNGKFMCNQIVLRGGSCVTPVGHIRDSYRNFFYPDSRWQFSGVRLAWDR